MMTSVNFDVSPKYAAESNKSQGRNSADPNAVTSGVYGSGFELALNKIANDDGTVTESLSYKAYDGRTDGSFSAIAETGSGKDISSAYASLFSALEAHGELDTRTASQLQTSFNELQAKSDNGVREAAASGGGFISIANGPSSFSALSSSQSDFLYSTISDIESRLDRSA